MNEKIIFLDLIIDFKVLYAQRDKQTHILHFFTDVLRNGHNKTINVLR